MEKIKASPVLPYVLLTFCALFWAGSSVVGRHVAGEVPPMALNFWRWLLAFLVVLTWTWKELYGDRFGGRESIGVVLGFAGVAFIVTRGDLDVLLALTVNIGDVLLLLATMSYSVYAVFLRRAPPGLSSSALMAGMFGFAALYMLPLWLIELYVFDRPVTVNATAVWSIGFMTIGPSVLAQIFWAYSVSRVGPGRAGYFIYLAPVFGVTLAVSLLGRWFHAAGIALIFTGIWLATRQKPAARPR